MTSLVLPRKKRRRPPGFWFWYNLFFVLFNIAVAVGEVLRFLENNHIIFLIGLGAQTACARFSWHFFKGEYDRWKDGE